MVLRRACVGDVRRIKQLIDDYMKEGFMLPRPLSELYENCRDFFVWEEDGSVQGCAALHIVWEDLAEVKSLVVDRQGRKKGWGKSLVQHCLDEARELKIHRVFALTKIPDFFLKMGFEMMDRSDLPHKVWAECIKCHKFPDCDESAVGIVVCERSANPIPASNGANGTNGSVPL
ncbi:MAG: N-acetyltransferase [Candidatus Omnitrophota bacterium]